MKKVKAFTRVWKSLSKACFMSAKEISFLSGEPPLRIAAWMRRLRNMGYVEIEKKFIYKGKLRALYRKAVDEKVEKVMQKMGNSNVIELWRFS